jgi:osmotically-inducible protein OsmY
MRGILVVTLFTWPFLALAGCSPAGMAIGAASTVGIAAVQERGFTGTLSDTSIKAAISEAYFKSSEAIFLAVTVRVHEGRVLLVGGLADQALHDRAVQLAWAQAGVKQVIDELQKREGGVGDYTRDTWITTQVNAKIAFDEDVLGVNYAIDTVGGVVYLMGIAQDQRELDRVIDHANDVRYVKRVISHVVLKDDSSRKGS